MKPNKKNMINCSKSNWSKSSVFMNQFFVFQKRKWLRTYFLWRKHFMNVWKMKLRSLLSGENVNDRENFLK